MKPGDVIHLVMGNNNFTHPIAFAAWMLGAVVSIGDPALDSTTIARQVNAYEECSHYDNKNYIDGMTFITLSWI